MRRKFSIWILLVIIAAGAAVFLILTFLPRVQLPSSGERDLNLLGIIISVLIGIGGIVVEILSGRGAFTRQKTESKTDGALRRVSLEELVRRLGHSGQVGWIDRQATNVGQLRGNGRLLITGRMRVGKTREAIELVRRAVDHDLVLEDQVFEPGPAFRSLNKGTLERILRQEYGEAGQMLLFLDDLPRHNFSEGLKDLKEFIHLCETCKRVYIIATARSDQLTAEHKAWLKELDFYEIPLTDLDKEQTARLLDSAEEVFGLKMDPAARVNFINERDGSPELSLMGLRLLKDTGQSLVSEDVAREVTRKSLMEAWESRRLEIEKRIPEAKFLLEALGDFKAAGVNAYAPLVLHHARRLGAKRSRRGITPGGLQAALDYLKNFDILTVGGIISHPAVLAEGIPAEAATRRVEDFLKHFRRPWQAPPLNRLHRHRRIHAWAFFDLGGAALDRQEYPLAVDLYTRSLRLSPHPGTYCNRGGAHAGLMDHRRAVADFTRAIELDPGFAKAYYNRGASYASLKENTRSLADFNKAIALNPMDPLAFSSRGKRLMRQQDYREALANYTRAIELDPNNASLLTHRGNTHARMNRFREALDDYDAAIRLDPAYTRAYYHRGRLHASLNRHDQALRDYNKAIELNPAYARAYFNLGSLHAKHKEHAAAIEDYTRSIEIDPRNPRAFYNRGNTHFDLLDFSMALKDYNRAIELDPSYPRAWYNRGLLHQKQGHSPLALADYTRAVELDPGDARALSSRGDVHLESGDLPAALADFNRLIELEPRAAAGYSGRGLVHLKQGNYPAAIKDYTKAIHRNRKEPGAFTNRGFACQGGKDYPAALADYARALELDPAQALPHYNSACCHAQLGKVEKALHSLREALRLEPAYAQAARSDPDLAPLREAKKFREVMKEFGGE